MTKKKVEPNQVLQLTLYGMFLTLSLQSGAVKGRLAKRYVSRSS